MWEGIPNVCSSGRRRTGRCGDPGIRVNTGNGASEIMPNKHIRVYELAKELNKTSKEIMAVLAEKNIEVTTHMATLEDNQAELVRGAVGSGQQGS